MILRKNCNRCLHVHYKSSTSGISCCVCKLTDENLGCMQDAEKLRCSDWVKQKENTINMYHNE